MPESRKRKPKPKKSPPPKAPPSRPAKPSLYNRLLSRRAIVIESIGTGAALLAFWQVWIQTVPVIDLAGSNPSQPFSLPFAVKNDSPFFTMRQSHWACGVRYENNRGGIFDWDDDGKSTIARGTATDIPPNTPAAYRCPTDVLGGDIKSLMARVHVHYHTLWIPRKSEEVFTWV